MRHASNPAPPEILILLKVYEIPMKYHEIGMAKFHKVFTRFRKTKFFLAVWNFKWCTFRFEVSLKLYSNFNCKFTTRRKTLNTYFGCTWLHPLPPSKNATKNTRQSGNFFKVAGGRCDLVQFFNFSCCRGQIIKDDSRSSE